MNRTSMAFYEPVQPSVARPRDCNQFPCIQELDAVLRGGIAHGSVTELCGPAGVGKSQLCMLLCVAAVRASQGWVPSGTRGAP